MTLESWGWDAEWDAHLERSGGGRRPGRGRLGTGRARDCSHESEPGYAVLEAVRANQLPEERLAGYRKLRVEAAHQAPEADPRARAERVAEHESIMKSLRHHPKYSGDR